MVNTKMMVGAVILASTLLVGCSKKQDNFDARVNAQISQLAADVQVAKAEADRANQRLDNLARNYRK